MSVEEMCETHVWASLGVTTRDGVISRVWECERCPAWTAEPFDPDLEVAWEDTWLAEQ